MENHNLILCHLLKNISVELAYMFWMSIPKHLSVLLDIKSSMNLKVLKLRETHNSIENVDGEEMRAQPKEGKTKLKKEERKWIR